jgi:acetolactate synthase-1/2/3 large subunit
MEITGGELVGKFIEKKGIEYVFGINGHGVQAIADGIYQCKKVKWILVESELVASAAASGYFKATHQPGVVCVSVGPGVVTTIPTLTNAAIDCSAIVVIAGDVPMQYWDKGASEEIDIHAGGDQRTILRTITKRTFQVTDISRIPDILSNAFKEAINGKPGPVLVNVPFDIQSEIIDIDDKDILKYESSLKISPPCCPEATIQKACDLLLGAKKPVVIAGGGVRISGAEDEISELASQLLVPVACTSAGQGSLDVSHPLYAGQCGRTGAAFIREITKKADVILAIGTRFEEYESCAWKEDVAFNIPPSKLIQIDISPREIAKNYPVEIGIIGDAKTVLVQMLAAIKERKIERNGSSIVDTIRSEKENYLRSIEDSTKSDEKPTKFRRLIQELIDIFPDNGILEVEAGTGRAFSLQQYVPVKRRNYFVEAGLQLIGYGPAEAIGIKLGRPNQPVISLTGDGAFIMTIQSVITSVTHNIPVVWIVLNNHGYNCVRGLEIQYFEGRSIGTEWKKDDELWSPDYVKLAEALGANGIRVEEANKIGKVVKEAIDSNKTWIIDIPVERDLRFDQLVSAKSLWDFYYPKWKR